ncbi:hypothetical protein GGG17_10325 [Arsenicicoccus sp. MKL-02]|uniref:Uncharacterized protein n=1 Tax=Arsenicicoccus cauae TaxID=2663847 RepID=A0A6I3IDM7_9MICO|nr:hypothetical protein [Arsenicicoccus cauae]MTB72358.1 hypothetical protein [Arsenicicoccus cauae]
MSNDATRDEQTETDADQTDGGPTALGQEDDLGDVPAAAGGQDTSEPAQGEGEQSSY